ncbi:hypothetical protein NUK34_12855 [Kerstersia gyiorum]|uniref:hypothetical protein n=1 Tax=Kerstersia gyiorum TaxID=206506 RepID=UPI00214F6ED0|nr:hypothetical protein [Kerstersia gyiorum]MCR4159743.1 hypothetical protein [Kerstersia gyiorum]
MNENDDALQLERTLMRQRTAFLRDHASSLERRRADLTKLRSAILANKDEITTAISSDFGHRSRYETAIMKLMTLIMGIDYLHKHLRRHVAAAWRWPGYWLTFFRKSKWQ